MFRSASHLVPSSWRDLTGPVELMVGKQVLREEETGDQEALSHGLGKRQRERDSVESPTTSGGALLPSSPAYPGHTEPQLVHRGPLPVPVIWTFCPPVNKFLQFGPFPVIPLPSPSQKFKSGFHRQCQCLFFFFFHDHIKRKYGVLCAPLLCTVEYRLCWCLYRQLLV